MAKEIIKAFRLDSKEAADLKEKSARACMSESSLVRHLIAGYEPRAAPPKEFYESMKAIRKIGNTLNQLTAKAHTLGYIDMPKLDIALKELYDFEAEIEDTFLLPERSRE